ncbi:hypothetical protein SISSUDRAFT_1060708 [Sistotremastrum suecicum HHB10207 ss-3]|uniref:Mid2 domain-containing protein n=1 Tax=Sistotremastrum suecicum HHB10207 ss-3 TaxID=1314776 RepID=A0A166ESZ8_9AGAM|nr:hypothetical protein SISSUDRAFT_1060708 [Sistotremastrum suecicum HHB10207 ss-3]
MSSDEPSSSSTEVSLSTQALIQPTDAPETTDDFTGAPTRVAFSAAAKIGSGIGIAIILLAIIIYWIFARRRKARRRRLMEDLETGPEQISSRTRETNSQPLSHSHPLRRSETTVIPDQPEHKVPTLSSSTEFTQKAGSHHVSIRPPTSPPPTYTAASLEQSSSTLGTRRESTH